MIAISADTIATSYRVGSCLEIFSRVASPLTGDLLLHLGILVLSLFALTRAGLLLGRGLLVIAIDDICRTVSQLHSQTLGILEGIPALRLPPFFLADSGEALFSPRAAPPTPAFLMILP